MIATPRRSKHNILWKILLIFLVIFIGSYVLLIVSMTSLQVEGDKTDRTIPSIEENTSTSPANSQQNSLSYEHFIVEEPAISTSLCMDSSGSDSQGSFSGNQLVETLPLSIVAKLTPEKKSATWQLCFAKHAHEHNLLIAVQPVSPRESPSMRGAATDCDLFLSATNPAPSRFNWDWKVDRQGSDSIKLHSFAKEFLESKLGALFITVVEKSLETGYSKSSHLCNITIAVMTMPDAEFLSQVGSFRGQVLLPR